MNLKRISSRVFSLICFVGFVLQVQQVSQLYFGFETTSRTVFQIRDVDDYQSIMLCTRFMDLLDRRNLGEYGILPEKPKTLTDHRLDVSKLTIKNILELTPSESSTIENCIVRQGQLSTDVEMSRIECHKFFKVMKSVNGERICYTFMPRSSANYSVGDVASSQTYISIVYHLYLSSIISKSLYAFFISSFIDESIEDLLDSRPFQANVYNIKSFNKSWFAVYGESIEIYRLPPPHDTRCTPGHDRERCYEDCLSDKLKIIDKVPWSGFHRKKLDMKVLTAIDLKNETISNFTGKWFKECHSLCKLKTECYTRFSRTTVEEFESPDFGIASMVPSQPHMSLSAVAFLNLIEYIIQIGSCFGMWFGLSIISFNPIKWKTLRKKGTSSFVNITRIRSFQMTRNRQEL